MRHPCDGVRGQARAGTILLAAALSSTVIATSATADVMLSVDANFADRIDVVPGSSFDVRVAVRTQTGAASFNSSIFEVMLGASGVVLEAYDWASPFATGSIFDDGTPSSGALPLAITASTLAGPGHVADVVDFGLSNVAESGSLQASTASIALVMLRFRLASDWSGPSLFTIAAIPDTFADGFDVVTAVQDAALTVNVVPSTGAAWLVPALALLGTRRRHPFRAVSSAS